MIGVGPITRTIPVDGGCEGETGGGCGRFSCVEADDAAAIPPISCQVGPTPGVGDGDTTAGCGADNPHHLCLQDTCDGEGRCVRDQSVCDEDELPCTTMVCQRFGDFGACLPRVDSGCMIDGMCIPADFIDPTDSTMCRICYPWINDRQWSINNMIAACEPD